MNEEIQNLMQTYQRSLNEADLDLVRSVYAADLLHHEDLAVALAAFGILVLGYYGAVRPSARI